MNKQADPASNMPRKRPILRSMASNPPLLTWPPTTVPVEIFDEITTYLSRSDVKNLRLVNHEFDRMVSVKYFRHVVVPFRSQMYNAREVMHEEDGAQTQSRTDTLLSGGMRIFQSFGDYILRFALSLELDEENLAYPPIKPTQKAVTSYWGIYRWPHESYHRYTELEGLEETADETMSMKEALKCLSKVQELGLCCDAGLGYLLGPDQQLERPYLPHPVFGLRNMRYRTLQQRIARVESTSMSARKLAFESPRDFNYAVLETMVKDEGYTQDQAMDAVTVLLTTENVSLMSIGFDEHTKAAMVPGVRITYTVDATGHFQATVANNQNAPLNTIISQRASAATDEGDADDTPTQRAVASDLSELISTHPLQPNNLTRAQKEMLLELEWAHRALIQSYLIALIDNERTNSFSLLTTLTIAKIPSSHIFMFQRRDLWQSLPNLTKVGLAVVADWRQVVKVAPGCVEDNFVSPVDAVTKVHNLLQEHIAKQSNITFLHFEWICGGEFAPGLTQRNQYVLPAPFCTPTQMLGHETAVTRGLVLSLPHIKHLSLKNCYSTPHVFLQFVRSLAKQSLENLELETVSLTGPPSWPQGHFAAFMQGQEAQPAPPQQLFDHPQIIVNALQPPPLPPAPNTNSQSMTLQPFHPHIGWLAPGNIPGNMAAAPAFNFLVNAQAQPTAEPPPADFFHLKDPLRLRQPHLLTWAGIIERLAPAPIIVDLITAQDDEDRGIGDVVENDGGYRFIPGRGTLIKEKAHFGIKYMSFKSCGYVCLDIPAIANIFPVPSPWQEPQETTTRRWELTPFMQRCTDRMAAKITNFLPAQEQFNLTTAYAMHTGWTNVYDEEVIDAARRDGILHPGKGRFSGNITKVVN